MGKIMHSAVFQATVLSFQAELYAPMGTVFGKRAGDRTPKNGLELRAGSC